MEGKLRENCKICSKHCEKKEENNVFNIEGKLREIMFTKWRENVTKSCLQHCGKIEGEIQKYVRHAVGKLSNIRFPTLQENDNVCNTVGKCSKNNFFHTMGKTPI